MSNSLYWDGSEILHVAKPIALGKYKLDVQIMLNRDTDEFKSLFYYKGYRGSTFATLYVYEDQLTSMYNMLECLSSSVPPKIRNTILLPINTTLAQRRSMDLVMTNIDTIKDLLYGMIEFLKDIRRKEKSHANE